MEVINIDFSGYIQVEKNDLKICRIIGGKFIDVDVKSLSSEEVVNLLQTGEAVLKSFGQTYLNDTIDGEENFEFSVEED